MEKHFLLRDKHRMGLYVKENPAQSIKLMHLRRGRKLEIEIKRERKWKKKKEREKER